MPHTDTMLAAPTLGRTLKGQYRIDSELGAGAMGVVFKGVHVTLGKVVAVKMLRSDGFGSKEAQERFYREARTASVLNHPSIASVFDFGMEDGNPYLVMEYVEGKELADVIREEGPMPPARAIKIMSQLASALDMAHKHGVVHRDIKPQNLRLMHYTPGGQIFLKVLDFGIAKHIGEQGKLTATGAVIGTPMYMAPEQATSGAGKVDGRADLYAAGIVFYELLTGSVPFDGPSLAGVLFSQIMQPPPPLPRSVPQPVREVVERLLKKQPEERYPDAAALERALQACEAACRDVPALAAGSVKPNVARSPRPASAWRTTAALGGGALVVAGVTMYVALTFGDRLGLRRQPHPAPPPPLPPPEIKVKPPEIKQPEVNPVKPPEVNPVKPEKHHSHKSGAEPDKAEPDAALSGDVQTMLEQAERELKARNWGEADELADKSMRLQKSGRAWKIRTIARCGQGDLGGSKGFFQNVPASLRKQVVDKCARLDVDLAE